MTVQGTEFIRLSQLVVHSFAGVDDWLVMVSSTHVTDAIIGGAYLSVHIRLGWRVVHGKWIR